MSTNDPLSTYAHTPGAAVLDRSAACLSVTRDGPVGGNAIACGDRAVVVDTGRTVIVTDVNHETGLIMARPVSGGRAVEYAGIDVEVTAAAHHPPLADDCLEGLTAHQARALMARFASDNGRYPQYGLDYFRSWVLGRARRKVRLHGESILVAEQRCLLDPSAPDASCGLGWPRTYAVWSTRRAHRAAAFRVRADNIAVEPAGADR